MSNLTLSEKWGTYRRAQDIADIEGLQNNTDT
jgi:hypothetical protein